MGGAKSWIALAAVIVLAGCGGESAIVVGSKNFTEQVLLGEIIAQHLEKRTGRPVTRRLNLGGTLLAHQALVAGSIDAYPEYTGTALTAVLKLPASKDAAQVRETVSREYQSRWKLAWMPPLGFNNSFAIAIRSEPANQTYRTLSEAATRKEPWALGVGYEFVKRPDGLAGLVSTYRLQVDGAPKEMDLGLLYAALQQRKVEMAAVSATDGLIDALHLRILEDDRRYFPPYEAAIVTRRPELREVLSELSGRFDDATMRRLNHEIDGKHRPAADVAREFLANQNAR